MTCHGEKLQVASPREKGSCFRAHVSRATAERVPVQHLSRIHAGTFPTRCQLVIPVENSGRARRPVGPSTVPTGARGVIRAKMVIPLHRMTIRPERASLAR